VNNKNLYMGGPIKHYCKNTTILQNARNQCDIDFKGSEMSIVQENPTGSLLSYILCSAGTHET
jgi:hypothetical protein